MSAEEERAEANRTATGDNGLEEIRSPSQWSIISDVGQGDHNYRDRHENGSLPLSLNADRRNPEDQTRYRSEIRSRHLDGALMTHVLRNYGMNPENPFPVATMMPLTFTKEVVAEKDPTTGSTGSRPVPTETRQSKYSAADHETGTRNKNHSRQNSSKREHCRNQNGNRNAQKSSSSIRQNDSGSVSMPNSIKPRDRSVERGAERSSVRGSSQVHSHGHGHGHGNEQHRDHKYASSSSSRPSNHHTTPDYRGRNLLHQHYSKDGSRPNSSNVIANSASWAKAPMAKKGNQANSPMMWKIRRVLKNTEGWLCPYCNGRFVSKTYRDTHSLTQKCQQIVKLMKAKARRNYSSSAWRK